jgi:hypothetical protein
MTDLIRKKENAKRSLTSAIVIILARWKKIMCSFYMYQKRRSAGGRDR